MEIIFKVIVYGFLIILAVDLILYLLVKLKERKQKHETIERSDVGGKADESTRECQPLEISDSVVTTENDKTRVGIVQPKKNIRA